MIALRMRGITFAQPLQNIIQTAKQMCHGCFSLVAHVGKAKGFAPNFAVAGIDHQMVFFTKLSRQLWHVYALVVFHAGEGL